jgi:MFS family permease
MTTPNPSADGGFFSFENRLLAVLFLVFGLVFLERLALPFLWSQISDELQLTNAHLGMLSSALALSWALCGALLGLAADKLNLRKPLLIGAIVIFSMCSALSGQVGGFITLFIFRLLMGAAEGPVLPISQSLMAEASQEKRRGLNMGLINGVGPGLIGAVLGPPIMIGLAMSFGWRTAFLLTLLPGLILAFILYRMVQAKPAGEISGSASAELGHGLTAGNVNYIELLKIRNIALCVAISCVYITWFLSILNFGPTFLIKARGFTEVQMAGVMSFIGFAWVFWGLLIPALSDRFGRKPVMIFFTAIAISCPYFLSTIADPALLGPVVFLTFTGMGCFTLFMATIPSETVSPTLIATALGLVMGAGEVVGGGVVPFVAGFLADAYGLEIVMWISGGGAALATLLSCFLDETAPIKRRASAVLASADLKG